MTKGTLKRTIPRRVGWYGGVGGGREVQEGRDICILMADSS